MLQAIQQSTGQLVLAANAGNRSRYQCPECGEEVVWRHGQKTTAHFAHHPGTDCLRGAGESREHLLGKSQLYQWAQAHGWSPQLEVFLAEINQRPDLLVTIKGQRSALEFQCSPLSLTEIRKRNAGYRSLGIRVHWLLGSRYQRHLTSSKCAQFTQLVDGHPNLLYWNTSSGQLVKRSAGCLSYCHSSPKGETTTIIQQTLRLRRSLTYRDPSLRMLAMTAYAHHHLLAACPLVAHDYCPHWPVSPRPILDWRLSCLLWLEQRPLGYWWSVPQWQECLLSRGQWCQFPCMTDNGTRLIRESLLIFSKDLVQAGIIKYDSRGVELCSLPVWFPSVEAKLGWLKAGKLKGSRDISTRAKPKLLT